MREQPELQSNKEADEVKTPEMEASEAETESDTRFAGGKPPPVGGAFNGANGTAQLAFEEDANEKELKTKVGALVTNKFGGDFKKAFDHYDADKDGKVTKDELVKLLSDAGVGNGLTRGVWASKIIEKLDRNDNTSIEWGEFESVFRATA